MGDNTRGCVQEVVAINWLVCNIDEHSQSGKSQPTCRLVERVDGVYAAFSTGFSTSHHNDGPAAARFRAEPAMRPQCS
jgi:hypothetical protein